MNPYLTNKAKNVRWSWFLIGFAALIGATGVGEVIDIIRTGTSTEDLVMYTCFSVIFLLPLIFKIRKVLQIRKAQKLAFGFSQCLKSETSFDAMAELTGIQEPGREAARLIEKGFLQNVIVDMKEKKFLLLAPNLRNHQEMVIQIQCPSCGGANHAVLGKLNTCAFCGSPLPIPGVSKRTEKKGRFRK